MIEVMRISTQNDLLKQDIILLNKRIAELESELKFKKDYIGELVHEQEILKLQQRAKGLEDYANEELSGLSAENMHWTLTRASDLREQAKQLMEHKGDD